MLQLPKPSASLSLENIAVVPPGTKRTVVQGVSFRLEAGQALGIIGRVRREISVVKALLGIWPTAFGRVRIDGADLWARTSLGIILPCERLPLSAERLFSAARRSYTCLGVIAWVLQIAGEFCACPDYILAKYQRRYRTDRGCPGPDVFVKKQPHAVAFRMRPHLALVRLNETSRPVSGVPYELGEDTEF